MSEILFVRARHTGTATHSQNTDFLSSYNVNFDQARDVRILSISSSGWLLSTRDSSEGGARTPMPMLWVALDGLGKDVVGPLYTPLDFSGVSGLTINVRVPNFLLADATYIAEWNYNIMAACYYELI
jgi:hypothetical protein